MNERSAQGEIEVEQWVLPVPGRTIEADSNAYCLRVGGDAWLIDAGSEPSDLLARLEAARQQRPFRLRAVLLTHGHRDHAGGAAAACDTYGARLFCGRHEAERVRRVTGREPDRLLDDGERVELSEVSGQVLEVLAAPGHTAGHVVFFLRPQGLLFSGDVVLGRGTTWIGAPDGDMAAYLATLRRLLQLPRSGLAPGHGPMLDDAAGRIEWLIQHREEREASILDLWRRGVQDETSLVTALYGPGQPDPVRRVAESTVRAHLDKLRREARL